MLALLDGISTKFDTHLQVFNPYALDHPLSFLRKGVNLLHFGIC